ncbi:DUF3501 family protein [Aestuariibacter halophilus]|uniref:DUF3501 family protein n=1 Tax=Fluctibacter halophilus TaxID=226011 RepID=A0ABS8GCA5_9ALTE|nr:DUF3501 family protein [Aestuariibacter halophilus]MCC2617736.1 DUF3501 family protein [Aestuariibacter halophilus]
MQKLHREQLMSLEEYAEQRAAFRRDVMAHKKHRQVPIGAHLRLLFEDYTTIHYQVQEMLRIERIFERSGIEEELDAYNPLIPDGTNLKATMMIEYADPDERKRQLATMIGIEKCVYLQVDGFDPVHPIANEDLSRETEEKTSSVHFLRFEFSPDMIRAWLSGASVWIGVEHAAYHYGPLALPASVQRALGEDFSPLEVTH